MKKLRLMEMKSAVKVRELVEGSLCPAAWPHCHGHFTAVHGQPWSREPEGQDMFSFLGMYSWKSCSTVALKFLEKDVNVGVLLKPREHPRQSREQAGVCQPPGGHGGREDQPADGIPEGGAGRGGGGAFQGIQEVIASLSKRLPAERTFIFVPLIRGSQVLLKWVKHFAGNFWFTLWKEIGAKALEFTALENVLQKRWWLQQQESDH